jgi:hypothetical protein
VVDDETNEVMVVVLSLFELISNIFVVAVDGMKSIPSTVTMFA